MNRVPASWIVALCVGVIGCEGGSKSNVLAGTAWRAVAWADASIDPSRYLITASFDDSRISGTAAVNSYSGPCTAKADGRFSVGEIGTTLMGGTEDAMRAEQTYHDLLRRARRFALADGGLTLSDETGETLIAFSRR